jgi:hypothetical protein
MEVVNVSFLSEVDKRAPEVGAQHLRKDPRKALS